VIAERQASKRFVGREMNLLSFARRFAGPANQPLFFVHGRRYR